jgi:hypothetical protein|tara:strand:- start:2004 stop:2528 length:525 start_codon:yes stop_codon:yes gene_type:complete
MIHAMIDLETLSTTPDAVILTVGGVKFDPTTQMQPYNDLYFRLDVDSQTAMGRNVQQNTLDWWAKQPTEIAEEALGEKDRISIEDACQKINKFGVGVDVFWCQGPLFDYAILQNLYAQLGKPLPWNYWQIRDSRTLFSLVPRETEKRQGLHNALEDCKFQAKKVQKVYRQLGIK